MTYDCKFFLGSCRKALFSAVSPIAENLLWQPHAFILLLVLTMVLQATPLGPTRCLLELSSSRGGMFLQVCVVWGKTQPPSSVLREKTQPSRGVWCEGSRSRPVYPCG